MRTNLSAYLDDRISIPELLFEVRARFKVGVVFWPTVRDRISSLCDRGRWLTDLELRRIADTGKLIEPAPYREHSSSDCWVMTIGGYDSEGMALAIVLQLPVLRDEPVAITDLHIHPAGFQFGGPADQ